MSSESTNSDTINTHSEKPHNSHSTTSNSTLPVAPNSSLSNDQLMDYIKKQKLKIKSLETKLVKYESNPSSGFKQGSEPNESSNLLFWEFINKQPYFQQCLAKRALSAMVHTLENSKLGVAYVPTVKNLFRRWKDHTVAIKLANVAQLEQKNTKLKALLARTHSISQKNIEDSNIMKQKQQDALHELKSLKEREEQERHDLMEQVRLRSIETAFQQDIELAIQRAADEMLHSHKEHSAIPTNTQQITQASIINPLSVQKVDDKYELTQTIESLTNQRQIDQQTIKQFQEKFHRSEAELTKLRKAHDELTANYNDISQRLKIESMMKHDLEIELAITNKSRAEAIQEFHQMSEQLIQVKVTELQQLLAEKQQLLENVREEYEDLDRKYNQLKTIYDEEVTRRAQSNANEYEIHQLKLVIADLRKSLITSHPKAKSDSNESSITHSSPSPLTITTSSSALPIPPPVKLFTLDDDEITAFKELLTLAKESTHSMECAIAIKDQHISQLKQALELEKKRSIRTKKLLLKLQRSTSRYLLPFLCTSQQGTKIQEISIQPSAYVDESLIDPFTARLADITSRYNILNTVVSDLKKLILEPITWEASGYVLPAGKDTKLFIPDPLPLPLSVDSSSPASKLIDKLQHSNSWKTGLLEWRYSGDTVQKLAFVLSNVSSSSSPRHTATTVDNDESHDIILSSTSKGDQGHSSIAIEYEGKHSVKVSSDSKLLKIINSALWGQAAMNYCIRLSFNDHNHEIEKLLSPLQIELEKVSASKNKIESFYGQGRRLATKLSSIIQSIESLEAINEGNGDIEVPSIEYTNISRLQEIVNKFAKKIKKKDKPNRIISEDNSIGHSKESSPRASGPPSISHENTTLTTSPTYRTEPIVFACESVSVRAGNDLRIRIPYFIVPTPPGSNAYLLSWSFELKTTSSTVATKNTSDTLDIGFAVSELQIDGALPQLVAYRRIPRNSQHETGQVIISFNDEPLEYPSYLEKKNIPIVNKGKGTSLVAIFDNSYSFFKSKELRYHISIESLLPGEALPTPVIQENNTVNINHESDDDDKTHEDFKKPESMNLPVFSKDIHAMDKELIECEQLLHLYQQTLEFYGKNGILEFME